MFIVSGYGVHAIFIQASADVHPGRDAGAAEGDPLHQPADGVQRSLEHVQAFH